MPTKLSGMEFAIQTCSFRFEARHPRLMEFVDSITEIYVFRGTCGIKAFHDYVRGENIKPIARPPVCV